MLNSQKNILKKIIATSFLLFLTFFLELISRYTINFGSSCEYSLFKIELIFIILIGFLFGFKYSFFASLAYLVIHYAFEYFIMEILLSSHKHNHDQNFKFQIFIYKFFLPYVVCCISGLFYQKKRNQLFEKWSLIVALTIISIVQISASILFIDLLKEHFLEDQSAILTKIMKSIGYSDLLNVIYSFLSVIINNLFIGVLLYLINFRLKDKLNFLYNFTTN
ncbi:putative membrane protein [Candidatus Phytoplasma solani]|uniref:hypothetical protein n=1 Tax=Candidatus Phytoplasma solani TaxID=69896 RepID=UPI0032DA4DDC